MFIQVDENLREHPKTVRLRRMLMNPQAHAFLLDLWAWCCKFAQDGNLAGHDPADIEYALGWGTHDTSQAGRLFDALVKCAWIDRTDDGSYVVHDWMEHQGKWILRMKESAEKVKSWRKGRRKTDHEEPHTPTPLELAAADMEQPELPIGTACNGNVTVTVTANGTDETGTQPVTQLQSDVTLPDNLTKPNQTKPKEERSTSYFFAETAEPSAAMQEPPVMIFPTDGKRKEWGLMPSRLESWREAYPSLDLLAECRKAMAWVMADSKRRKTFDGMPRFLVNWFNTAQNRGNGQRGLFQQPQPANVGRAPVVAGKVYVDGEVKL